VVTGFTRYQQPPAPSRRCSSCGRYPSGPVHMCATSVSVWRTGKCIAYGNGINSLVCKRASDKTARHQALNELVAPASVSAGIPVTKEPHGLSRPDGKRPDSLSLMPCHEGEPLCWDVTVVCSWPALTCSPHLRCCC